MIWTKSLKILSAKDNFISKISKKRQNQLDYHFHFSFLAKWSSSEEVNKVPGQNEGPANGADSPFVSRKNKDYKPVTFDSNSLKRSELKHQVRKFGCGIKYFRYA